jgi:hypothetical protein
MSPRIQCPMYMLTGYIQFHIVRQRCVRFLETSSVYLLSFNSCDAFIPSRALAPPDQRSLVPKDSHSTPDETLPKLNDYFIASLKELFN